MLEFESPLVWVVAWLGLYSWSFWLWTVAKIRQETLAKYSNMLPPPYSTLTDNNLPSFEEATRQ
jgi:hypothetical protein